MHPTAMFQRLTKQLADFNVRTNARLDRLEAKVDMILRAAGLAIEQPALEAPDEPIDVELVTEPSPAVDQLLAVEEPTDTTTSEPES